MNPEPIHPFKYKKPPAYSSSSSNQLFNLSSLKRTIRPLIIQLRSVFFIKFDGGFIPLQHLPHHSAAVFFEGLLHGNIKKQFTDAITAGLFSYDDILEVKSYSFPG